MTILARLRALLAQRAAKPSAPVATTTELGAATENMQQLLHIRWWHWRMRFLVAKKLQLEEQTHEN